MGSDTYHEALELLSEPTKDMHRAIVSLCEELEAIDWYAQRAEATKDASLKAVLLHNKNEEIEHAMMNLEWLRRNSAAFDEQMRTYLFKSAPIVTLEAETEKADGGAPDAGSHGKAAARAGAGSLGIGSLKPGAPPGLARG